MENFNETIKSARPTLVDFFATWCGPCRMMHPVLEQLKSDLGDSIKILKVDIDQHEELSTQYRIRSVPTLILFKDGKAVWRQSGAMGLNEMKAAIERMR